MSSEYSVGTHLVYRFIPTFVEIGRTLCWMGGLGCDRFGVVSLEDNFNWNAWLMQRWLKLWYPENLGSGVWWRRNNRKCVNPFIGLAILVREGGWFPWFTCVGEQHKWCDRTVPTHRAFIGNRCCYREVGGDATVLFCKGRFLSVAQKLCANLHYMRESMCMCERVRYVFGWLWIE